ncbi:MAG: sugar phosphate isomerase/epimerase [Oscillospiraceae bacterium]|nr:sugar phosphate isomerase/epimerase [Oscillospiraceae bacterium]
MRLAAFYENIMEGADAEGRDMKSAVRELMDYGLERLYISYWTLRHRGGELAEVLADTGIGVEGLHGHFELGAAPSEPGPEMMIREAKRLGAENVLIVPGMIPPEQPAEREMRLENMRSALRRAVRYGEEQKIAVTMEDFDGLDAPYNSVDGLADFLNSVPGLGCSFDTGNFVMYHEDALAALPRFREKLCNIHLKDRSLFPHEGDSLGKIVSDGTKVYAAAVGTGCIPIREILQLLYSWRFGGTVIVELYGYEPRRMLDGLRRSLQWTGAQLKALES